jgi:hypothetical protein
MKQCPGTHQSSLIFFSAFPYFCFGCLFFVLLLLFVRRPSISLSQTQFGTFNPTLPSTQIVSFPLHHVPTPSLTVRLSRMSFAQMLCSIPTGGAYSML